MDDQNKTKEELIKELAETRLVQDELRREKEMTSGLIRNSPAFFSVLNAEGKIVMINDSMLQALGYSLDELINQDFAEMLVEDSDRETWLKIFEKMTSSKSDILHVTRVRAKNGAQIIVEWHGRSLYNQKGEFDFFFGIGINVTARKKAEEKSAELQSLKNKFIEIVSHQLRTPLNAIRWNLEGLLTGSGELTAEQKALAKISYDSDNTVINRLNDLLTALDIEENRTQIIKTELRLENLVASVISAWKKKCELKNIQMQYEAPSEALPAVSADNEKIKIVLEKFVENAFDYTNEKGTIAAVLSKTETGVRFEIKDSGIGIPESDKKFIFTRFFRTSNAVQMKPDASGIGLFIAKHFIEDHGGKIGFESTENQGSTFWFELPYQQK